MNIREVFKKIKSKLNKETTNILPYSHYRGFNLPGMEDDFKEKLLFDSSNVDHGDRSKPWAKIMAGDIVVIMTEMDEKSLGIANIQPNTPYIVTAIEEGWFGKLELCIAFKLEGFDQTLSFRADYFLPLDHTQTLKIINSNL